MLLPGAMEDGIRLHRKGLPKRTRLRELLQQVGEITFDPVQRFLESSSIGHGPTVRARHLRGCDINDGGAMRGTMTPCPLRVG